MYSKKQPSPAPTTPKEVVDNSLPTVPMRQPTIGLILAILSIMFAIIPFLGLGLGLAGTILGFKSVFKYAPTNTGNAAVVIGLCGAMFGIAWLIAGGLIGFRLFS